MHLISKLIELVIVPIEFYLDTPPCHQKKVYVATYLMQVKLK